MQELHAGNRLHLMRTMPAAAPGGLQAGTQAVGVPEARQCSQSHATRLSVGVTCLARCQQRGGCRLGEAPTLQHNLVSVRWYCTLVHHVSTWTQAVARILEVSSSTAGRSWQPANSQHGMAALPGSRVCASLATSSAQAASSRQTAAEGVHHAHPWQRIPQGCGPQLRC